MKNIFHLIEKFTYDETSPSCIKPSQGEKCSIFIDAQGYWCLKYAGESYKVHRIVYGMFNPCFDQGLNIDHINRIRSDNRIQNLRLVSHATNMKNKKKYRNNKTGHTGITLRGIKGISYLRVYIRINGVLKEKYINVMKNGGYEVAMERAIRYRDTLLTDDFLKGHGHD